METSSLTWNTDPPRWIGRNAAGSRVRRDDRIPVSSVYQSSRQIGLTFSSIDETDRTTLLIKIRADGCVRGDDRVLSPGDAWHYHCSNRTWGARRRRAWVNVPGYHEPLEQTPSRRQPG
jgi:hypothetical protein